MPFPSHVAPDELIESQWGNDVVDTLTSHNSTLTSHTSTVGAHTNSILDQGNQLANLNAVRSVYIAGAPIGPVGGSDYNGYNMITYGIARSGVLLLNGAFGVNTLGGGGTFADLDVTWWLNSSVGRVNRQTMLPDRVHTFTVNDAIRCFAGQTLYVQVKRVAGSAGGTQFSIADSSGVFNGVSILEGIVAVWV